MSVNRGRFPGRPLSARRPRMRQRLRKSDVHTSSSSADFETAKMIQRGLDVFHNTFILSDPTYDNPHSTMVRWLDWLRWMINNVANAAINLDKYYEKKIIFIHNIYLSLLLHYINHSS